MKCLIFSDLHLHEWTYGATYKDGMNSRLLDQAKALNEIRDYALTHSIRDIYFCGDMFVKQGVTTAAVISVAYRTFADWRAQGLELTALVGNHDMGNRAGTHCMDWLKSIATVIDGPVYGERYSAMPYTDDTDTLVEFLMCAQTRKSKMIFMHQGVEGADMGSGHVRNEILTPKMIPEGVPTFTGHYHLHNRVSDDLTIVGSLTPQTGGDTNVPKGFLVFDDETREIEFIEVGAPQFLSYATGKIQPEDVDGNFIRIEKAVPHRDELKDWLEAQGALTVEIPVATVESSGLELGSEFKIDDILEAYQKRTGINEQTIRLGEELRKGTYAFGESQGF